MGCGGGNYKEFVFTFCFSTPSFNLSNRIDLWIQKYDTTMKPLTLSWRHDCLIGYSKKYRISLNLNHLSRVISTLWRSLRTSKVCVTRCPSMETSARLFNCENLECCFYVLYFNWLLPLVLIIVSLVLPYVRKRVWIVVVTWTTYYKQHIHIYFITITNAETGVFI